MELLELIKAYDLAERNKRKNPLRVGFELHKYARLVSLRHDIENHAVESVAYAYVVYRPVVREVFSAPMGMCIIDHLLDERIRPALKKWINPCVYNNIKGRGLEAALIKAQNDIARLSDRFTKDCWCIVCDTKGFFPNADIQHAYTVLEPLLLQSGGDTSETTYLLRLALFCNKNNTVKLSNPLCWKDVAPHKSIFNKPFGIGAMPGKLIMQTAMTCYHDEVIKWASTCGAEVTVYGDDMLFVTKDKDRFLRYVMPELRKRMARINCTIHPNKFYCQHFSKGVKFCSQFIKMSRRYVGKRTIYNFKQKIKYFNRRASANNIERFISMFNSYLGFMKNREGYAVLRNMTDDINNRWRKFVAYDDKSRTLKAKEEYNYRNRLNNKYHIKILNAYGNKRKRKHAC